MALAIDIRMLTDKELVEECLLHGSDAEKRLASYCYKLLAAYADLKDEFETYWEWN